MKPKLIVILGATAVGKSDVALTLAEKIAGEIVNADSQQVYRYMDIGTGKPSRLDRERIAHHVIDVVEPDREFNVAVYRQLAIAAIDDILTRDRKAIICGGTGLYIKALTEGLFVGPAQNSAVRGTLVAEIERRGLDTLYQRLERVDPAATSWIHPNDRQRIIRALEVFELTGKRMSLWQKEHAFKECFFETLKIGLSRGRAKLYALINDRCEKMIEDGLLEEVKGLTAKGYPLSLRPLQSVGYRHMGQVLRGELTLENALMLMKQDTRHLAKRQLTWFRRDREIRWFDPETDYQGMTDAAASFLG